MRMLTHSSMILTLGIVVTGCQYNPEYNGVNAGYNRYCGGDCAQYQVNSVNSCCSKGPRRQVVFLSKNYLNGEYNGYGFYNQDYSENGYYTTWYTYYGGR